MRLAAAARSHSVTDPISENCRRMIASVAAEGARTRSGQWHLFGRGALAEVTNDIRPEPDHLTLGGDNLSHYSDKQSPTGGGGANPVKSGR